MRQALFVLLFLAANLSANAGQAPALPDPADVFTVGLEPERFPASAANAASTYFTPASLRQALSSFLPIDDPHDARPLSMYQQGVIVLKDQTVLFWMACSVDYFLVRKQGGGFWFYGKSR